MEGAAATSRARYCSGRWQSHSVQCLCPLTTCTGRPSQPPPPPPAPDVADPKLPHQVAGRPDHIWQRSVHPCTAEFPEHTTHTMTCSTFSEQSVNILHIHGRTVSVTRHTSHVTRATSRHKETSSRLHRERVSNVCPSVSHQPSRSYPHVRR